jgi:hypothetical protein
VIWAFPIVRLRVTRLANLRLGISLGLSPSLVLGVLASKPQPNTLLLRELVSVFLNIITPTGIAAFHDYIHSQGPGPLSTQRHLSYLPSWHFQALLRVFVTLCLEIWLSWPVRIKAISAPLLRISYHIIVRILQSIQAQYSILILNT